MRVSPFPRIATAVLAVASLGFASASAETVNCTAIDSAPFTITAPGVYCLTGDLTSAGAEAAAITIQADHVTLDLNGHTLLPWPGNFFGVGARSQKGLTIRNGRIVGFPAGVVLNDSEPFSRGGHLVEGLEVRNSLVLGIVTIGRGNVVRRNRVMDTVNPTSGEPAIGIWAVGTAARVLDNDVIGTRGLATGIEVNSAPASVVEGNRVTDTFNPSQGGAAQAIRALNSAATQVNGNRITSTQSFPSSIGISISGSRDCAVRDNVIDQMDYGIVFGVGGIGKYMGNLVSGVRVPYSGGTPAGTTNY